jgi:membrane-anchored protein YejM (alkaline phosphatase superfamily)
MVTLRQPYREKVSQMVSWGHWFALFNMLLAMVLGSRYLFVADWPTTLAGRLFRTSVSSDTSASWCLPAMC